MPLWVHVSVGGCLHCLSVCLSICCNFETFKSQFLLSMSCVAHDESKANQLQIDMQIFLLFTCYKERAKGWIQVGGRGTVNSRAWMGDHSNGFMRVWVWLELIFYPFHAHIHTGNIVNVHEFTQICMFDSKLIIWKTLYSSTNPRSYVSFIQQILAEDWVNNLLDGIWCGFRSVVGEWGVRQFVIGINYVDICADYCWHS